MKEQRSVEFQSVEDADLGLWVPVLSDTGRSLWYVLITALERLTAGAETC